MENMSYLMGKVDTSSWRGNDAQQLTFVVTQDCNLRCKYCYMIDKNNKNVMDFDVAKKIVDYFVDNSSSLFSTNYIILDFIGGEPLLEIDLISKIVDYFMLSTYIKNSKWFGRFRINIQSNGVLVNTPKVQRFLRDHKNIVALGITIDGTQVKHDLQRVFPNGKGSYEIVEKKYIDSVKKQYTEGTKVTFGSEDLKYLKESIIHLWKMGIQHVSANIVYEDVWKDGDKNIYFEQLIDLADYIIDNELWDKYNTTFFSDSIGFKKPEDDYMRPVCGTGNMYCVDSNGDIYNCVRFMQYSLNEKESKKIGDIYKGVDRDKLRPLKTLYTQYLSDDNCINCKVNLNCTYCAGNNYDVSKNDSMFYRSTAICEMFKAQVKANNYYWARLYNEHNIIRDTSYKNEYFMYFILSSDSVNYCRFPKADIREEMSIEDLIKGLEYAYNNFYQPVFVHSKNSEEQLKKMQADSQYGERLKFEMKRHIIKHILIYNENKKYKNAIYVIDGYKENIKKDVNGPVILNIKMDEIRYLAVWVKSILPFTSRVNINICDLDKTFDMLEYEKQLKVIVDILFEYISNNEHKEIRQLTDRIYMKKMNNCFAGEKNITYAPDGKYYICPAFYYDKSIKIDTVKSLYMTYRCNSPGCDNCDAYQCERCVYKNINGTGEINTPTEIQCKVAHVERRYSIKLLERLKAKKIVGYEFTEILPVEYDDPVEALIQRNSPITHSLL